MILYVSCTTSVSASELVSFCGGGRGEVHYSFCNFSINNKKLPGDDYEYKHRNMSQCNKKRIIFILIRNIIVNMYCAFIGQIQ